MKGIFCGLLYSLLFWGVCPAYGYGFCEGELNRALLAKLRIVDEWPLRSTADPISEYIQDLGILIARNDSRGKDLPWRFSVVRNYEFNAFSIGAGQIIVTDGVVMQAESESDVAAVLAHELGHELAGHFCKERDAKGPYDWIMNLFGRNKQRNDSVEIGSMMQTVDHDKEYKADQIAVKLLLAAGFDVKSLGKVIRHTHLHDANLKMGEERIRRIESPGRHQVSTRKENSHAFTIVKKKLGVKAQKGMAPFSTSDSEIL